MIRKWSFGQKYSNVEAAQIFPEWTPELTTVHKLQNIEGSVTLCVTIKKT